jgi:hypothetical protein
VTTLASATPTPPSTCHTQYNQLANGDVKITATFAAAQFYAEIFTRVNGNQISAGNIVSTAVTNGDGTVSYTHVIGAPSFHAGDAITYRFYSYTAGHPGVFMPGPAELVWFPAVTYSTSAPPTICF